MKLHISVAHTPNDTRMAKLICISFACSLLLYGALLAPPGTLLTDMWRFITSRAVLLTDFFSIGSIGSAFFNAGLVMVFSIGLTILAKTPYTGNTVAALFLMPGFALFGKNPFNILPFFLGAFLYARYQKEPMSKYTTAALYSTSLVPVVNDILISAELPLFLRIPLAILVGIIIGFIAIPLAEKLFQMHWGYNLFNYGFTCGILAYLLTSVARTAGLPSALAFYWQEGIDARVLNFLLVWCIAFLITGVCVGEWRIKHYITIWRRHEHKLDHISAGGMGPTLMNMGFAGLLCIGYILLIGGSLSGPVVGAIFTCIGFAAATTHPLNLAPVMLGVYIASISSATPHATAPSVQLAVLFGATALAPIASEFGPIIGVLSGILHFSIAYMATDGTGGYNLYNNGFAAGLVACILVTLLHAFLPRLSLGRQRKILRFMLLERRPKQTACAQQEQSDVGSAQQQNTQDIGQ